MHLDASGRLLLVALACSIAAGGLAEAATDPSHPTPENAIRPRRAAMMMSSADLSLMRASAQAGGDVKELAGTAAAMRAWSRALVLLFPAGTARGQTPTPSRASPKIWSDWAGFEADAAAYTTEIDKLVTVAKTGDKEAFLAQSLSVAKACDACHAAYRLPADNAEPAPQKPQS
jgi:cytochrome c556